MQHSHAPHVTLVPRPRLSALCPDLEALRLTAHMRALRSVLPSAYLPPPIVPLRAQIVDTRAGQRLFLELQNLAGVELDAIGVEAVILDHAQHEIDVMFAALSDLCVAADPRRVVPIGGFTLDPEKPASSAVVTTLYARFADGSMWDGALDAIEDPRLPEHERTRAQERFFAPYRRFMHAIEGRARDTLQH